jgi:hypothetical protein
MRFGGHSNGGCAAGRRVVSPSGGSVRSPESACQPGSNKIRSAQVTTYGKPIVLADVPEPVIVDPYDVIVRIAGAGICRTDLHVLDGGLEEAFHPTLPLGRCCVVGSVGVLIPVLARVRSPGRVR